MGKGFEVVAPQFGLCYGGGAAAQFCANRLWKRQVSVFSSPSARGVWMCRSASSRQRWEGGEWSLPHPPLSVASSKCDTSSDLCRQPCDYIAFI